MAVSRYVVEEWVATVRQKDSFWMVFHKTYNDLYALNLPMTLERSKLLLDESEIDTQECDAFLAFMAKEFPSVRLTLLGDLMPLSLVVWPYLDSIGIEADLGSDVYNALAERYNLIENDPKSNGAVLWGMYLDDGMKFWKKREESWDEM
ncbi:MAG: hypothetical protein JXK05_01980 [Campylobacterales bacterium]|nr:hypothetical protein [Campylobacterales bacterium]